MTGIPGKPLGCVWLRVVCRVAEKDAHGGLVMTAESFLVKRSLWSCPKKTTMRHHGIHHITHRGCRFSRCSRDGRVCSRHDQEIVLCRCHQRGGITGKFDPRSMLVMRRRSRSSKSVFCARLSGDQLLSSRPIFTSPRGPVACAPYTLANLVESAHAFLHGRCWRCCAALGKTPA